jgi:general secretion pathway protein E/type IV pilus assembly protein PilB
LREAADAKNFRSLADEGVLRVVEGTTSLAEVARAIDLTGRVYRDAPHHAGIGLRTMGVPKP